MESITITKEQFTDAIKTANEKFMEIGDKDGNNGFTVFMMGLQNVIFWKTDQ